MSGKFGDVFDFGNPLIIWTHFQKEEDNCVVVMSVGNVCNLEVSLQVHGKSLLGMGSGSNSRARIFGRVPGLSLPHGVYVFLVVIVVVWAPLVWFCTLSYGWVVEMRLCVIVESRLVDHEAILLCYQFLDVLVVL